MPYVSGGPPKKSGVLKCGSTGHLLVVPNSRAGQAWISYMEVGMFYSNLKMNASFISYFPVNISLVLLVLGLF